ncbi:hypothetical protein ILYODFUR_025223 [Ilyodon furcidens]|uniref:Secreted protein n=1 Tax=Ilyodon furcidens TaxID=33524 RepID=A0ABV0U8C1_9TELE
MTTKTFSKVLCSFILLLKRVHPNFSNASCSSRKMLVFFVQLVKDKSILLLCCLHSFNCIINFNKRVPHFWDNNEKSKPEGKLLSGQRHINIFKQHTRNKKCRVISCIL